MKTQDELFNEYIDLLAQMREDRSLAENDEFLDKCDLIYFAMDDETHNKIEEYFSENSK